MDRNYTFKRNLLEEEGKSHFRRKQKQEQKNKIELD